ncbi:Stk1 family PASTA domain-containing Ser/Thr kinase [Kineosporia mesophila]|nr:Stk1 family PASTA domain-containing Ser/Thr kinase [Kineosporia mesophila]
MNDNVRVLGNRYEIGDLIGRGGMAEVHAGRDARLGRTVAIKLLRTDLARDATFQARFRREAQSSAALNHPSIVAVYDTGEESIVEASGAVVNLPYIVMEIVEGRTLREVLGEGHHLDVDAALEITTGVLAALEYSHRIGIVHRDIKPANVMLTPVGDVKVMDFGIARAMADSSSQMTQTQAVIGTAQYLSPEQARGEQVDTRSDLYSAGCLLYELLTGRPPFMGDSPVSVAYQHVREQPIPPSHVVAGIPEAVDRIVLHSLAKGRDERYQTAQDFRADVEAARGGRQIYAPAPAMTGSNSTTQFMPAADGTRAMSPVPGNAAQGAAMYGDQATTVGGQQYDPFQQQQQDDYGRRSQEPEPSNRKPLMIGAAVLAVIVVLLLVMNSLGVFSSDKGADGGDTTSGLIAIPKVIDKDQAIAKSDLVAAGFDAGNIKTKSKKTTDADKYGKVMEVDPNEGEEAAKDATITLTIGKKPDSVTVPSLIGKSLSSAKSLLTAEKLTSTSSETKNSTSTTAGVVVSSDPASGDSVDPGTEVKLLISSAMVTVPDNLIGMSYQEAKKALANVGLKASSRSTVSSGSTPGTVLDSSYQSGFTVTRGATVALSVAKAPTTTTTTTAPSEEPSETTAPTETADPTESAAPTQTTTEGTGDGGDDGDEDSAP